MLRDDVVARPSRARPLGDQPRSAVVFAQNAYWLEAVESVLTRAGVDITHSATDVAGALALAVAHGPDIFVIDFETGDGEADGLACLRLARKRAPAARCIVLSERDDLHAAATALAMGATACVTKNAEPDDLAFVVRQSFEQSVYLAAAFLPLASARPGWGGHPTGQVLTSRELEILRLAAEGRSNAQLARALQVTEQTVKFHLSNVYRKIDVSNRTEAARWAQLHGLLTASDDLPISA